MKLTKNGKGYLCLTGGGLGSVSPLLKVRNGPPFRAFFAKRKFGFCLNVFLAMGDAGLNALWPETDRCHLRSQGLRARRWFLPLETVL
jgi:hypothetical protein